jgi:SAM-dependent methyltransferase
MKVNIACGRQRLLGFVNVDADPWVQPDVVAVPMDLPFEAGSVAEIHAAQVLEHLADPVAALRHWRRLLVRDGVLWVAVASRSACPTCVGVGAAVPGRRSWHEVSETRPEHCFSPYFLTLCLRSAGYREVARVAAAPYSRLEAGGLLSVRAVNAHPLRRLTRCLEFGRHRPASSERARLPVR